MKRASRHPAGLVLRGFTMIELLVVIAVFAVVAAVVAPGMRSFADTQRVKTLAYDMTTDLLVARNEARTRGVPVTMAASAASDWGLGWTVVAGDTTLGERNKVGAGLTLTDAPASITFDVNGRVAAAVRMSISTADGAATRCIELDPSGRAKSKLGECS